MNKTYKFPCPNCGKEAIRSHFLSEEVEYKTCPSQKVISTSCSACDYRMTMCSLDGKVIESSSPKFSVVSLPAKVNLPMKIVSSKISAKKPTICSRKIFA